ncbi:MAG: MBL fold metallo-hydrolase [Clostridia bacterium]|nr:MBL fold metallo-hydrolase [Clostridia bacterium]
MYPPLFGNVSSHAEIHLIADETQLPADWSGKELFRLTVLDTERSDAMLLQCGGENMMVDGGSPIYYPRLEAWFEEQGITEFKYLYNTHPDSDHITGLYQMMRSGNYVIGGFCSAVKQDYEGSEYHKYAMQILRRRGVPYVQIYDGDVLTLGNAVINVIRCDEPIGVNNRSAACQIRFGESKALLTGDCGNEALRYFLENRDHALFECDVMKAQHHGINGIIDDFLDVAQPEFVFVPNRPREVPADKKKRFDEMGAWYSGEGTIIMETDGSDWYIWQLENIKEAVNK